MKRDVIEHNYFGNKHDAEQCQVEGVKPLAEEELMAFLLELAQLTLKYKLKISGCGCCNSPAIERMAQGFEGYYEVESASESGASLLRWSERIDP